MDIYMICLDRGLVSMELLIVLIYKVSELSLIMEYKEKQNNLVIYTQILYKQCCLQSPAENKTFYLM